MTEVGHVAYPREQAWILWHQMTGLGAVEGANQGEDSLTDELLESSLEAFAVQPALEAVLIRDA